MRIVRRGAGRPDPQIRRLIEQIDQVEWLMWLRGDDDDDTPLHPDWKRDD